MPLACAERETCVATPTRHSHSFREGTAPTAIGTPSGFSRTLPTWEELRSSRTLEGAWSAALWQSAGKPEVACCFYVDGHRKPVYADKLIPRGLIGCSGKILGCRALVLLHDDQGHPRLAMTHRGDQHLTLGLPQILARSQEIEREAAPIRVVVDREGMAAPFLSDLKALGHTIVTVLRTDQYEGLESFTEVGTFVPLERDRQGQVVREVAPACFKKKKRTRMFANLYGGKRVGKRNQRLLPRPPPN
jgi:hypothetical protein